MEWGVARSHEEQRGVTESEKSRDQLNVFPCKIIP